MYAIVHNTTTRTHKYIYIYIERDFFSKWNETWLSYFYLAIQGKIVTTSTNGRGDWSSERSYHLQKVCRSGMFGLAQEKPRWVNIFLILIHPIRGVD